MFDSGITAKDLTANLKTEIDAAYEIPDETYVMWISALEQLLYSELIREQRKVSVIDPLAGEIELSKLYVDPAESSVRFEDIYTVFADGVQLIKSTAASGVIFPYTFYKSGVNMGYSTKKEISGQSVPVRSMTIIYFVRPAVKKAGTTGNVMIPYEFIDLVKAKVRGEAYKLVNEDAIAAKWLNDYNVLLESFKQWLSQRQPVLGM